MPLLTTKYGAHVDADFYQQAQAQRSGMRPQQSIGLNSTDPNFVDADGYTRPGYNPTQTIGSAGMPLTADQQPSAQPGATASGFNPNYNIGGALDFGAAGANFDFSGNPAAMSQNYANTYMDALKLNAENYGNILGGYQQTMQNQLGAQDQLNQNYDALGNKVQGLIAGTDAAQMQRVQDQYNSAMGSMNQGAIDRGLGNTTVTNALSRGVESDRAKAQLDVQNQFAQLQAGYASNIGLAGLNQQGNNILQNTNQSDRQLDWMNSINAPYPNPSLYNQLGQQYGQGQQGAADRGQIQGMLGQVQKAGQQGSGQTGLNSGGGGGVRQSAFGPGFSGGNQSPNFGPSPTGGGGYSVGSAGGGASRIPGPGGSSGGGGGLGGYAIGAAGGGVMPGGYYPGSPASVGSVSAYGGVYGGMDDNYDYYADSAYDPTSEYQDPNYDYYADSAYDPTTEYDSYNNYDLGYEDSAYGGYYDDGYTDPGYADYGNYDYGNYDLSGEDSAYGGYDNYDYNYDSDYWYQDSQPADNYDYNFDSDYWYQD